MVEKAKSFQKRLKEVEDEENPELPSTSSDSDEVELKCDTCDVFFSEVTELREHNSEAHPGIELKLKGTKKMMERVPKVEELKRHLRSHFLMVSKLLNCLSFFAITNPMNVSRVQMINNVHIFSPYSSTDLWTHFAFQNHPT